ncbi:response regulator [Azospirillum sp. B506]|uniref:response regulator n=1 Tax=Azospirillum sp. B506 TaxID=137721 RepID=UPI0003467577|nr:response regulator transcription factor [Azospirillum sp. B506]
MRDTDPHILVVDDDPGIRLHLSRSLAAAGYAVTVAADGGSVLRTVVQAPPSLLLLDLDALNAESLALIDAIRRLSVLPVIGLSATTDGELAAQALERGADDVVRKPFALRELLARIRNTLRRAAAGRGEVIAVHSADLEIDLLDRVIRAQGRLVRLSRIEFAVLRRLVQADGAALSHRQLLEAVWGTERVDRLSYLRVAIRALRRKIESNPQRPRHILTEPGIGYRLEMPLGKAGTGDRKGTMP